ncbi:MAG: DUF4870 domain-containing protein [Candidatus Moranbacteria bacterium]|nr:DUF4870 domain-containing protein [Candidatus Moranbacteria bacterium]MDD5652328.1 DUF4870 domain-containing protein [Candidatus Moranbacteria bacterium]MDX9855543.1 DUF4870 domain-containing protein [Candidatus Moranbacteria bacterium]
MNQSQNQPTDQPAPASEPQQANTGGGDNDVEKNKLMAIVGYIFPILFFIPLVTEAKDSPFAKFHANQQLILLIFAIAVNIIGSILPIIGWFLILPIGSIMILVFVIMGVINASQGKTKALPLIGGFQIIK